MKEKRGGRGRKEAYSVCQGDRDSRDCLPKPRPWKKGRAGGSGGKHVVTPGGGRGVRDAVGEWVALEGKSGAGGPEGRAAREAPVHRAGSC